MKQGAKNDEHVRTFLAKCEALAAEIIALPGQLACAQEKLSEAESTADVSDPKALDEIVRSQALVALLPRRLAAREAELEAAEGVLASACYDLVLTDLGPRGRRIEALAEAKARGALREHFSREADLVIAVSTSTGVLEARSVTARAKIDYAPADGAMGYARGLLALDSEFARLEETLK
jgi:hypothetical protein